MAINTKGGATPNVAQISSAASLVERLPSIGTDLVAAYSIMPSPARLPGAVASGDPIGRIVPAPARRTPIGQFPSGRGRGATLDTTRGVYLADLGGGILELAAPPTNRNSFGCGILFWLDASVFGGSNIILVGNAESGGTTVPHVLRLNITSNPQNNLLWDGITAVVLNALPQSTLATGKIVTPGWHEVTFDIHGGQAGMQVDSQGLISAPQFATPTLSSFRIGSDLTTGSAPGMGAAFFLVCDGPLAQHPQRQAEWRALTQDIRRMAIAA
jgi:hypothetical protein